MPDATFLVSEKVSMVQVMAPNASKGTALATLVSRWGYSMENVIAFGDDINDTEMLRDAAVGVAMANAVEPLKAVANRMTGTNDEEGVAVVLEEYLMYNSTMTH